MLKMVREKKQKNIKKYALGEHWFNLISWFLVNNPPFTPSVISSLEVNKI